MAKGEQEAEGLPGGSSGEAALQDHLAYWVEVLDSWVKRVDLGMGRPEGLEQAVDGAGIDEALLQVDDGAGPAKEVEG
jgi:hypothetical protein